jgi:hypothetical protein
MRAGKLIHKGRLVIFLGKLRTAHPTSNCCCCKCP